MKLLKTAARICEIFVILIFILIMFAEDLGFKFNNYDYFYLILLFVGIALLAVFFNASYYQNLGRIEKDEYLNDLSDSLIKNNRNNEKDE